MPKSIHQAEYRRIIDTLREAREVLGVTQVELAKSLRRSQQWVSLLERGDRRLDIVEYLELCSALGLDPHELLDVLVAKLALGTRKPAVARRHTAARKSKT